MKSRSLPELLSVICDGSEVYKNKLIGKGDSRTSVLEKSKYNVTPSNVEKEDIADLGESTYKQMWNVIILALVYCLKDMLAQRVCAKIINSGQIQVEFFQGSSFFYFFMALIRVNYLIRVKLNLVWIFHDVDNSLQNFPNQSEFGLESASCKINF